jgi:DNA-binding Lrp family transcriptional regulator
MRPVARPQSALRYPLNAILASEARVRLLRVLAASDSPRARAELAREAGLSPPGAWRSLLALEEAGIVELLGAAAGHRARLRVAHPLCEPLRALFRSEASRYEQLFAQLRAACDSLLPPPVSAWIESADLDSPALSAELTFCALAPARGVDSVRAGLETALADIERTADVLIGVRELTRADLEALDDAARARLSDAVPIYGPHPNALVNFSKSSTASGNPFRVHPHHDARSRALARAIADALRRDPSILERARSSIEARIERASHAERHELREWLRILRSGSPAAVRRFLSSQTERATRLRQSLPFFDALTQAERDQVLADASSAERDSAERNSAERDSAERDSAERDSAERDSAERDGERET